MNTRNITTAGSCVQCALDEADYFMAHEQLLDAARIMNGYLADGTMRGIHGIHRTESSTWIVNPMFLVGGDARHKVFCKISEGNDCDCTMMRLSIRFQWDDRSLSENDKKEIADAYCECAELSGLVTDNYPGVEELEIEWDIPACVAYPDSIWRQSVNLNTYADFTAQILGPTKEIMQNISSIFVFLKKCREGF